MIWTTKVRLSLLGIATLPPIFFLSTSDLQQAIFVSRSSAIIGGLLLGLLLGLLAGFVWWRTRLIKKVFAGVSVSYYLMFLLGVLVFPDIRSQVFRPWGEREWIVILPFLAVWLVVFWCVWVVVRDVAIPMIFGSEAAQDLKAPVWRVMGPIGQCLACGALLLSPSSGSVDL